MSDRVGVMSQGRLQQVANPRDIYNNPVNGFVASFVGENNIFTGEVQNAADGMASFATPTGTFRARLPGAEGKLYIRPEHMVLQAKASKENSVAVTLTEVAFEGNFVSVHGITEGGKDMVAELRNDGSTPIPSAGAKMHMVFEARNAAILPDSATAGA
jgi:spermidine/putrescine transport system ATP-binding protein